MQGRQPECPSCGSAWPVAALNTGRYETCTACGAQVRLHAWPALLRAPENAAPAQANLTGEAACFQHPGKMAVAVCDECGRFLCALCDLELNGRHRCASCLQQERTSVQRSTGLFEPRRVLWDNVALSMAALPLLLFMFWFMTLFGAPATLFVVFRFWRRPLSVLPRTRVRFVIAFLLAVGEIIGWGTLAFFGIRTLLTSGGGS